MAKYLIEETTTTQAAAGILENPEDRFEVLKPIFEKAGCQLEQFYISGIENKSYLIVEAPELKNVYTVGAVFQAGGTAQSIKCVPLIPMSEMVELAKKAASLSFRPPGK